MNRLKSRILLTSAFALLASLSIAESFGQNSDPPPLPSGNWSFTAGPYSGPGYQSASVDVYSVTTNAEKGLTVTSVALNNRTTKEVNAVRLHWSLIETTKGNTLFEGETPSLGVAIDAGKQRVLHYPVASFARIAKSLMKRSTLSGSYRLEVRVSDVSYADESARTTGQEPQVSFQRATYVAQGRCQNQGCVYVATEG